MNLLLENTCWFVLDSFTKKSTWWTSQIVCWGGPAWEAQHQLAKIQKRPPVCHPQRWSSGYGQRRGDHASLYWTAMDEEPPLGAPQLWPRQVQKSVHGQSQIACIHSDNSTATWEYSPGTPAWQPWRADHDARPHQMPSANQGRSLHSIPHCLLLGLFGRLVEVFHSLYIYQDKTHIVKDGDDLLFLSKTPCVTAQLFLVAYQHWREAVLVCKIVSVSVSY